MVAGIRRVMFGFLISLLSVSIIVSQDAICSELVEAALQSVENNCAELGRNELCYGFNNVQARFANIVPEGYFSRVSDKSPIADIVSVQSLPMNSETGEWGIAVMNLQANMPNTLPGQNLTFVMMGDVELENAVAPENAFTPSDGIEISLAVDSANLRSGAGLDFNVIDGVYRGETLIADGLSEDGEWLRVTKGNRPLWLNRALVVENDEIETLPVLTDALQTPMQSFYLRTGIGQPACLETADNILLVQGPEDIEIRLTINGVTVELGSSGAFRIIESNEQSFLEVLVFDGEFEIEGTVIHSGQRSLMCLGDANSRGLDGESNDLLVTCEPSPPEAIENFGLNWCNIENIPEVVLNYELEVLCPGETPPPSNSQTGSASASELREVNCSGFAFLTGDIPATDFTLSWAGASGADNYEVAVYDASGYQVSSTTTTSTSLGMNGGTAFPSAGYVDLRAYRGGIYACFTRLNFTRSADPNENLNSNLRVNCSHGMPTWTINVSWSNVAPPITISYFSNIYPDSSTTYNTSSGSYSTSGSDAPGATLSVTVTTGDGTTVTKTCS